MPRSEVYSSDDMVEKRFDEQENIDNLRSGALGHFFRRAYGKKYGDIPAEPVESEDRSEYGRYIQLESRTVQSLLEDDDVIGLVDRWTKKDVRSGASREAEIQLDVILEKALEEQKARLEKRRKK